MTKHTAGPWVAELEKRVEHVASIDVSQKHVDKTSNNEHEPVAWLYIKKSVIDQLKARIAELENAIAECLVWVQIKDREKPYTDADLCGEMVGIRLSGLCLLARAIGKRDDEKVIRDWQARIGGEK